ncbi:MAG: DUF1045 domain-containing protein [Alphaproteobacteria bacterium]|nr:DUF1045 domain-containing protein [Alphaproteobacteria bacterium]
MRYAVYYTPAPGSALARFGSAWFARSAPCLDTPRRYGFHGTLKAPFRLAAGVDETGLLLAVERFAAERPALSGPPLGIAVLADFLALVPSARFGELDRLAADCVAAFDRFRAPPGAAELARRRRAGLNPREEALLRRWGYPYVMDAFRFHLTLTGRLDEAGLASERAEAKALLGEAALPLFVDAVTVAVEPAEGAAFRLLQRFEFGKPGGSRA